VRTPSGMRRGVLALGTFLVALHVTDARAEGLSAIADVSLIYGSTRTQDAFGRTNETTSLLLPQRYRLSLDRQFYPFLRLNALAGYEWNPGWFTVEGLESSIDTQRWNVYLSAMFGPPVLNATPYYSRRQDFATTASGLASVTTPTFVNQSYGIFLGWNPAGLPLLNLRLDRSEIFDTQRTIRNARADELFLSLAYLEVQDLTLRYTLRWGNAEDLLTGVKARELFQSAQVGWSGSYWSGRLQTSLNYTLGVRFGEILSSGAGNVSVQQFPIAGLSLVETFPSIPSQNTLAPNPALIDGDVLASAGVDIGFGPSLGGDQNFRDLGVQFPSTTTQVNVLRVWVDRQLPAAIWSTFSFTAWQSQDNVVWTQLPINGPVTFDLFENRFEIPILRTTARYLKVVTKPLSTGVTVDPRYSDIFVTEMQAWLVVPASELPPRTTDFSGNFSGSLRWLIFREWNVAYTLGFSATHASDFVPQDWSVQNALSAGKTLSRTVYVGGRVERTDSGRPGGLHEVQSRWSALVGWDPVPAVGATLSYSGQVNQIEQGRVLTNGFTLTGRLDLYPGVTLFGTGAYSWSQDHTGRELSGVNGSVGASIIPMQALVLTGTWSVNTSVLAGSELAQSAQRTTSLQATATFSPVSAIYFSAGIIRATAVDQPNQTLANFSAGISPFSGGQLVLRFGYDETLDSAAKSRNRIFGPSARWNIRGGTYVDVGYTWNDSIQPALLTQSQALLAHLVVTLN